ncbi:hypothetical protein UFOVP116_361 [uncultured Caudovirales phage]|uniref:Uncharacterized protein n=1 Tax=uncultured Caudovirales phage TaxID=2100421 RepID=A0A6J5LAE6_9CAUD|nr:hypothetical protein UFOVP116_361 [uncultured Caudovirales phage]
MIFFDIFILFSVAAYLFFWAEAFLLSFTTVNIDATSVIELEKLCTNETDDQKAIIVSTLLDSQNTAGK